MLKKLKEGAYIPSLCVVLVKKLKQLSDRCTDYDPEFGMEDHTSRDLALSRDVMKDSDLGVQQGRESWNRRRDPLR